MSDPMPPAPIPSESNPTPPPLPEADAVAKSRNVPLIGIIVALALLLVAGIILLVALLGKGSAGGEGAAGTSSTAGKTATVQKGAPQDSQAQKMAGPAGAAGTKQPARGKSADQKAKAIAAAKAQGKQVFEGTIRILSHAELTGLQGISDPNPDYSGNFKYEKYAILVFDRTQTVTGMSGDGTGTQTGSAKLLCVGAYYPGVDSVDTTPEWVPYNGKRVVVAGTAEDMGWPSDTSLPLGEPRGGGDVIFSE